MSIGMTAVLRLYFSCYVTGITQRSVNCDHGFNDAGFQLMVTFWTFHIKIVDITVPFFSKGLYLLTAVDGGIVKYMSLITKNKQTPTVYSSWQLGSKCSRLVLSSVESQACLPFHSSTFYMWEFLLDFFEWWACKAEVWGGCVFMSLWLNVLVVLPHCTFLLM